MNERNHGDEARQVVTIRLSPVERDFAEQAARATRQSLSAFAREAIEAEVRRVEAVVGRRQIGRLGVG